MNQAPAYHELALKELTGQAQRASLLLDYGKSEELLLRAYEHARQLFGPDHGEVGLVLLRLVAVCNKQGKTELANEYLAETEKIVRTYTES
ncbi:MAG: tetratricopeptide repeat protein [Cyanobacteria bacterium SZAS LIN-3]|nr:tetratricopeptide repeat protein [Cyanobacteria bacterium SZAS LIN-3]MBS2005722.1 tetratricopeptide repeat protein [Cyanobacteria bacterium SZAS TMP-1]